MSDAWFHCDPLPNTGGETALGDREARHATGARRLTIGECITLFDGRGETAAAHITELSRQQVRCVIDSRTAQPPTIPRVHVASALPRGDRQAVMLGMMTQLGLGAFMPLRCARSVVRPSSGFTVRARRVMLEACKQSRRARLPALLDARSPLEAVRAARDDDQTVLIAHPDGESLRELLLDDETTRLIAATGATVLIGPEGGFTDRELPEQRDRRLQRISLGPGILRIETAAVATLAAVMLTQPQ